MNDFTYSYPVKVYFGTDAAKKAVSQELGKYGKTVMVVYGGGSVKKSGVYDAVVSMLKEAGKEDRERYLGDGVYGSCIPNGICSYGRDCDRNRNRC